jgi:hypothetical protein
LLAKIIYYDENYIIAFLTGGHRFEVYNNVLLGVVRNRQELEKTRNFITRYVGSVIEIIILNILFDIGQHAAPVVAGAKKTVGLILF